MPAKMIQDWVLEMWGYAIAAASVGVRHKIVPGYQIEPNAYAHTDQQFHKNHYIFHYTYGIEYRLDGYPQGFNTIGEWTPNKLPLPPSHPLTTHSSVPPLPPRRRVVARQAALRRRVPTARP